MPTKFTRDLPVKLTDAEQLLKGKELSKSMGDLLALESEAADVVGEFKKRIKDLRAEIEAKRLVVETGQENSPIACQEVPHFESSSVEIIREDTGEVIQVRPMNEAERQRALFKDQKAAEATGPAPVPIEGGRKRRGKATVVETEEQAREAAGVLPSDAPPADPPADGEAQADPPPAE